jgi:hypothetical protein
MTRLRFSLIVLLLAVATLYGFAADNPMIALRGE